MIIKALQIFKKYNKVILYLSLSFLCWHLYNVGFIHIPKVYNMVYLSVGLLLIFLSNIIHSTNWGKLLSISGIKISLKDAVVSNGLFILTKFIPGKVWVVLGKASFIAEKYNRKIDEVSLISFQNGILGVWSGFTLGVFGLIILFKFSLFVVLGVILAIFLAIMVLKTSYLFRYIQRIPYLKKFSHKLESLSSQKTAKIIVYFFAYWISISLAFWFIVSAIQQEELESFTLALVYPLSITIGITAVLSPGGIGVREGFLVWTMVELGFSQTDSISAAVLSRLLFVLGEVTLFFLAFVLNRFSFASSKFVTPRNNKF